MDEFFEFELDLLVELCTFRFEFLLVIQLENRFFPLDFLLFVGEEIARDFFFELAFDFGDQARSVEFIRDFRDDAITLSGELSFVRFTSALFHIEFDSLTLRGKSTLFLFDLLLSELV